MTGEVQAILDRNKSPSGSMRATRRFAKPSINLLTDAMVLASLAFMSALISNTTVILNSFNFTREVPKRRATSQCCWRYAVPRPW